MISTPPCPLSSSLLSLKSSSLLPFNSFAPGPVVGPASSSLGVAFPPPSASGLGWVYDYQIYLTCLPVSFINHPLLLKKKTLVLQILLFNFVFDNEIWPERWAMGIIFPLYKQDSRLEPGNYQPITLLSIIGKLFGSVIESRLSAWSESTLAIADEQGGFRRSRGTPDLIFLLREIVMTREMRGQCTLATFIDARKAYDTVWREGNYVRLYDLGVRGKLWRQLQKMSADPKSKIRLPFGETEYFRVSRGVAQGAVEPPFLYACFVKVLTE